MSSSSLSSVVCRQFSLDEIKDATNNFDLSNVLGQGGEGVVYLGHITVGKDGKKFTVAVKRLNPNSIEFEKEIEIVSKIRHANLVSLLGYCDESNQKILVYEYMERGSLSDYVKTKKISICLSWKQRLKICLGVARGLQYLHTATDELPRGIIHRDMKPANILLDKNWVAKVSDFGMFKLSHADQTNSSMLTALKGTSGYYAPEYIKYSRITRKIDVYAFGVVLFEVLCGKRPWDRGEDESYYIRDDEDFGVWAQENVDVEINWEISGDSLKIFTDIIRRSLQQDPGGRLTMDEVVLDLERALKCHEDHEGFVDIHPKDSRICADCNAFVRGRFRGCIGVWHPECFHCHACNLLISDDEYFMSENHPFHISCYKYKDMQMKRYASDQDIEDVVTKAFAKRAEALEKSRRGKRKDLSPQDAAVLIQITFRAYLFRRFKVLRALRELAINKAKLKELRALFNNFSYRRRVAHDAEERQRFSEKIIVLLLTLDDIEGVDLMVRTARRSMTEELDAMLETVDPKSQVAPTL